MIQEAKLQLLCILVVVWNVPRGCCIRSSSAGGFHYAVRGTNTSLPCDFDLEGDTLYSIFWWRGDAVVGRFLPARSHPTNGQDQEEGTGVHVKRCGTAICERDFLLPFHQQIRINDKGEMTGSELVISNIVTEFEGKYVCELTSEAPAFYTVNTTYFLKVINPPERDPLLFSPRGHLYEGTEVKALCYSAPTTPSSQIQFLLNNDPVVDSFMTKRRDLLLKSGQVVLERGITFIAQKQLFDRAGRITLECEIKLKDLSWKSSSILVLHGSGSSGALSLRHPLPALAVLSFILHAVAP